MITPQQTNALAQELLSQLPALIGDEAAAELTAQLTPLLAEPPDRSYLQVLAQLYVADEFTEHCRIENL